MSDLLRVLLDVWQYVWPLKVVRQWERGVLYAAGRYWSTLSPGVWPVIPFFMELRPVSVVPSVWSTPLQTITLRDGRSLTFSAMVTVQVEAPALALNAVEEWPETTLELAGGMLGETLADVDPARFDPARGKRDRLLAELASNVDALTREFGVRVMAVRLPNFALGVRTYRLLSEPATVADPVSIKRV